MNNLEKHAEIELKLAGLFDKDSVYGGMLGDAVMELIKVFSKQEHSGMSASVVSDLFNKLSRFKPLTPLTFKDDEWSEYSDGKYQNKRNSAVFKDSKDGHPYYIDAYYKKTQKGTTWGGSLDLGNGKYVSRCYIKDPKNMPSICIDVIEREVSKDNWEMKIANKEQLKELQKYYNVDLLAQKNKEVA